MRNKSQTPDFGIPQYRHVRHGLRLGTSSEDAAGLLSEAHLLPELGRN